MSRLFTKAQKVFFELHNIKAYYINLKDYTYKNLINDEYGKMLSLFDSYINNCDCVRFEQKSINRYFSNIKNGIGCKKIELSSRVGTMPVMLELEYEPIDKYTAFLFETSKPARIDQLTKLYNSDEFCIDMRNLSLQQLDSELTFISFDINGLKQTNTDFGHIAGDELIKGAAECIMTTYKQYGKCYRTGGDEFAAIVYVPYHELESKKRFLEGLLNSYKTDEINGISISYGCASIREFSNYSLLDLRKKSDERLYEDKNTFYLERSKELIKNN